MAKEDKLKRQIAHRRAREQFPVGRTVHSHRIFSREGVRDLINLQPTRDGKAKPYQVKQVRQIVKAYSL